MICLSEEEAWSVAPYSFCFNAYFGLQTGHCHDETGCISTVAVCLSADTAFYRVAGKFQTCTAVTDGSSVTGTNKQLS